MRRMLENQKLEKQEALEKNEHLDLKDDPPFVPL